MKRLECIEQVVRNEQGRTVKVFGSKTEGSREGEDLD
jgi:hypothetical protein